MHFFLKKESTAEPVGCQAGESKSKHKRLAQNTLSDTSVSTTKLMVERESCAKPHLTGIPPVVVFQLC
jgi:hypothetical protein